MIDAVLLELASILRNCHMTRKAALRTVLLKNNHVWLLGDDLARPKRLLQESGFTVEFEAADVTALRINLFPGSEAAVIVVKVRDFAAERAVVHGLRAISDAPIVVMAEALSLAHFRSVLQAEADGYLELGIDVHELQRLLALIIAGEKVVPQDLVKELLNASRSIN